jgi:hypothetical protein
MPPVSSFVVQGWRRGHGGAFPSKRLEASFVLMPVVREGQPRTATGQAVSNPRIRGGQPTSSGPASCPAQLHPRITQHSLRLRICVRAPCKRTSEHLFDPWNAEHEEKCQDSGTEHTSQFRFSPAFWPPATRSGSPAGVVRISCHWQPKRRHWLSVTHWSHLVCCYARSCRAPAAKHEIE